MTGLTKMLTRAFERFVEWRQIAAEEALLRAMSDRELADIGLSRGDIRAVVSRRYVDPRQNVETLRPASPATAAREFEVEIRKAA